MPAEAAAPISRPAAKAGDAGVVRQVEPEEQRDAEAHHRAAGEEARVAVGGEEAAEEGRRAVGAGDDGQRQGEQGEAAEQARRHRHGPRQRHHTGQFQHRRPHHHDGHEHAAVDRPLAAAGVPLAIGRGEGRRHAVQRVDGEAGDDVERWPTGRPGRPTPPRWRRPSARPGRPPSDAGRSAMWGPHDGLQRRAEQQRVVAPVPVEASGHQEAAEAERDLAEGEEHEPAAGDEVDRLGHGDAERPGRAEVVHHARRCRAPGRG